MAAADYASKVPARVQTENSEKVQERLAIAALALQTPMILRPHCAFSGCHAGGGADDHRPRSRAVQEPSRVKRAACKPEQ